MLTIIGKMKCDKPGCTTNIDCEIKLIRPDYLIETLPEGWEYYGVFHLCPEHTYKKTKEKL